MLPPELLRAISHPSGGRVVIVAGAGCSVEAPTGLPMAGTCAKEAHRRLRADNVLESDCADPSDLSCVADAVFASQGLQEPLVSRLPREAFRMAQPNEGHLLAAALLREGAIACVLTLNFDLAFSAALNRVGAQYDVAIIAGPEQHAELGTRNLIYLHRNADAPPEEWILRSDALDEEWKNAWSEVIVARVLSSPVTVFAGLGSPCGVLTETAQRIREALPKAPLVYHVDIVDLDEAKLAGVMQVDEKSFLKMSWVEFMRRLAARVLEEQRAAIVRACAKIAAENDASPDGAIALAESLRELGLLRVGKLRARWLLEGTDYSPDGNHIAEYMADLLRCISAIVEVTGVEVTLHDDGVVEFWRGNESVGSVLFAHGCGRHSWATIEARIETTVRNTRRRTPHFAVVAGMSGSPSTISAIPSEITGERHEDNIISAGTPTLEVIRCHELHLDKRLAERLVA